MGGKTTYGKSKIGPFLSNRNTRTAEIISTREIKVLTPEQR